MLPTPHQHEMLWSIVPAKQKLQVPAATFMRRTAGGGVTNLSVKFKYQNIFVRV